MNPLAFLYSRNLVRRTTYESSEALSKIIDTMSPKISAYIGIDPTSDGLHLGHYLGIKCMRYFQKVGIKPIFLIGGFTAQIGDPSGKSVDRNLISEEIIDRNVIGIENDLKKIIDFDLCPKPLILNNKDWLGNKSLLDFMRLVGSQVRLSSMLTRSSVADRVHSANGISYLEFSYQLFQAYDFYHLHTHNNCILQLGGSDQWGNITAGIGLVKKISSDTVNGICIPLITTQNGKKLGKTAGNAIWLNPNKTTHYQFYQYLKQQQDSDVETLFYYLTDLSKTEITDIMRKHNYSVENHYAQTELADIITNEIRGSDGVKKAKLVSEILFGNKKLDSLKEDELNEVIKNIPNVSLSSELIIDKPITEVLVNSNYFSSKNEAKKFVKGGGLYINAKKIDSPSYKVSIKDTLFNKHIILRIGKKNYHSVLIEQIRN